MRMKLLLVGSRGVYILRLQGLAGVLQERFGEEEDVCQNFSAKIFVNR